jgi:hypothetical protein
MVVRYNDIDATRLGGGNEVYRFNATVEGDEDADLGG